MGDYDLNCKLTESLLRKRLLYSFAIRRVFSSFLLQKLARLNQRKIELVLQTLCVLFALATGWAENKDSFHYFE